MPTSKLVELIVVLVILALLMAVLIPTLMGWIDKAREQQITTNANAALVASQGLYDEAYGKSMSPTAPTADELKEGIIKLTDMTDDGFTVAATTATGATGKNAFIITGFVFNETVSGTAYTATWSKSAGGTWTVTHA